MMANSKSVEDQLRARANGHAFEDCRAGPTALTSYTLAPKSLQQPNESATMSTYLFPSIQKMMSSSQEIMQLSPQGLIPLKKGSKMVDSLQGQPLSSQRANPYLKKPTHLIQYDITTQTPREIPLKNLYNSSQ